MIASSGLSNWSIVLAVVFLAPVVLQWEVFSSSLTHIFYLLLYRIRHVFWVHMIPSMKIGFNEIVTTFTSLLLI